MVDIGVTLAAAGWTVAAVHAFTVFRMLGVAANNNTITLSGKVYTWKTVINNSNDGEIFIGADAANCLINLKAAINLGTGAGTLYSSATTANADVQGGRSNASWLTIEQIAAGAPTGLSCSESTANSDFSNGGSVSYVGYEATSATTPAGLACKYLYFDAQLGNLSIQNIAYDINSTYFSSPTTGTGENLFSSYTNLDMRVIADKYQCFVFVNNCLGSEGNAFWSLGVPWVPDQMIGLVVSNVVNAGGLIKITTSTAHGLTTGELVGARGISGVPAANVTNNAMTVVDTTSFTLDGTTFAGAYTGGGFVGVTSIGQANFKVIEAIWQGGTGSSNGFIRRALQAVATDFWTLLNGSVLNDGNDTGALTFATTCSYTNTTLELLWGNGDALVTEPFICFGTSNTSIGPIIGQAWNSIIMRKLATRDQSGPIDGHTYWNLTDNFVTNGMLGCFLYAVT